MAKVREELRKELFDLRMKLQLLRMEGIQSDNRVTEVEERIKEVKKQMAKEYIEFKENERNEKRI